VTEQRLWVPEPDPHRTSPRLTRAFLVPVFRDDAHGRVLAEVNWADLSRFPVSLFGLFEGMFSLLFGLRHVAAAAAAPNTYRFADTLRGLGRTTAFLLIGPLAATNLLMLCLLVSAAVADWIAEESFAGPAGDACARVGCVLAAAVGGAMWWWLRSNVYRWMGGSLVVTSVGVLAAAVALQQSGHTADVWEIPGMNVLTAKLRAKADEAHKPPDAYTGGVVLYAAIAVQPMAVAFFGANAAAQAALLVYLFCFSWKRDRHAHRSALAATVLPFAMLFGWCILIPFAWLVTGVPVSEKLGLSSAFRDAYQLLLDFILGDLPLWFMVLAGLVVAGGVAGLVWWWQKPVDSPHKRLIVAW